MKETVIFLIGFMGSGKSTFGRKLAKKMGYAFIDMDDYIEEKNNKKIPDIFKEDGEAHFRELEHQAIKDLSNQIHCVIATGGGAPCFHNNIDLMNELGQTVYLQLSPEKIAARLVLDPTERPVLQNKTGDELVAFIGEKLKERDEFYLKAQHVVDADIPEQTYDLI